jgi:cytoskeletal protein CcmA (bactofilin family)
MFTRDDRTRRIEDRAEPVESVIALGTTLEGNLRGPHGLRVLGTVEGDVESGGRVKIESGGRVHGKLKAVDVIVNGLLEGDIEATGQVELGRESRMTGDIKAAGIAIAEGCFFQGKIDMSREDRQPVKFVEKRASAQSTTSISG